MSPDKKKFIQNMVALLISEDRTLSVSAAIIIAKSTAEALDNQGLGWR